MGVLTNPQAITEADPWAYDFFQELLQESLTQEHFEEVVDEQWNSGDFILSAPRTAEYFLKLASSFDTRSKVGYACNDPSLEFKSHWLIGKPDRPGAVYIQAPPEKTRHPKLSQLNRPVHLHDSGRINLVTSGEAEFLFLARVSAQQQVIVSCPVSRGDIIFWPGGTAHTFNALKGFSVLSSMPNYVSPEEDGYSIRYPDNLELLDILPQYSIAQYQSQPG